MRHQVAVNEHINPDFRVVNYLGGKRLLYDVTRCYFGEDDAAVLQPVLEGQPGQLESVLKPLDGALPLQFIQFLNFPFQMPR